MANEAEDGDEAAVAEDRLKAWRPSLQPEHRADRPVHDDRGLIVERPETGGVFGAVQRYVKRPFVKLVIGLGLFILGAIVYDATVNFGSWTERQEKAKATRHQGLKPVPEAPE